MGQFWRILWVALLVGMSLSACSPKPAPSPAPTPEAYPSPVQSEVGYPSPGQNMPTNPSPGSSLPNYPSPAQELPLPSYNPYPGPSEGVTNFLEWAKVEELILGGKVAKVYQAQTMNITLVLKDGTVALTIEPAQDEVVKVIEKCGQACSDIEQIKQ